MKCICVSREHLKSARDAINRAIESDEPDVLAAETAAAGDAIERHIVALDGSLKGFRKNMMRGFDNLISRG